MTAPNGSVPFSPLAEGSPFTPRGNGPIPATLAGPLTDPREASRLLRLLLRAFTAAGNGIDLSVTTGATSVAVTFKRTEPNNDYGVNVIPSWNTSVWVAKSDRSTTGFTAHFGTAPSGSPGTITWQTFRSEDS